MENNHELSTKLTFKIENKNQVGLMDLTLAFFNVGNQYKTFIKTQPINEHQKTDLYIKEIKSGSIIIDLIAASGQLMLPSIPDINVLLAFGEYLESTLNFFLGKREFPPRTLDIQDCKEFESMVNLIANDKGSNLNIRIEKLGSCTMSLCLLIPS